MKTEIVVSLWGAMKRSPNREPDEFAYFTQVGGFRSLRSPYLTDGDGALASRGTRRTAKE